VVKDGSRSECDNARKIIEVIMCKMHLHHDTFAAVVIYLYGYSIEYI